MMKFICNPKKGVQISFAKKKISISAANDEYSASGQLMQRIVIDQATSSTRTRVLGIPQESPFAGSIDEFSAESCVIARARERGRVSPRARVS